MAKRIDKAIDKPIAMNTVFLSLIERARARQAAEGGISSDEMRRRLSAAPGLSRGKATSRRPRQP